MDIKITYRGIEQNAAIEDHIREQLKKIEEFTKRERGPAGIELFITQNAKFPNFKVSAAMNMATCKCVAEHAGADVYEEINIVIDRLYTQVLNCKEKKVDRKKHGCDGECRNERYKKDETAAEFEIEEFIDLEDEE
jgi:ribosomal subunit interface protein